ncbi:poly(A)-specific ribonuclease PARN-like [Amphibalanus amphitrite]|uniref:poly(A)-specific ribonuclease PARN-like n=1 Tax=Amphibalanus amphitrite TaxID=1232801 RepID=UPI001C90E586|nr:poly(A)-specific ribonuclease PARN-like [Amphibalanus amphitrite]XP_043203132.1 poly(A)-specific ribonuclease PARN-like [Amphibalanus amphitrite]XP_043203133.1 poly(A)-specific ribonuclease PARN-like [Amphibalanus amphitrite]XP_043203134.1 poly(A)-specific ribonuclease PARN-like [Amphibalanus amphitrite]XP_043203135.1 poly(A)-specific ribonuclease PARN-like [Amphibalanus amphitrite]
MDVTKDNFASSLERIRAAICRSSFLAVDCEFSGLSTGGSSSKFDTPEERYAHLRRTASGFLVIQFGLAAFTLEKEKNRYIQETFNFYLFPRHQSQGSFICQPSSMEFLLENGFDFNKLIKDGIPYLPPAQVESLRDRLESQLRDSEAAPSPAQKGTTGTSGTPGTTLQPTPVPENQADFVERAISEINKFVEGSEEYLDFHKLSPFQRKLLYDHVPNRISTPLELETVHLSGSQRTLRVGRPVSDEQRRERARRRVEQRVDEAAGFAQVIQEISKSGKPVVGHNMLLDLLHIIEQFVCPLPETYSDFKSVVHCVFPTLVDTKVMGSTQPFRDLLPATSLGEMTTCLGTHPFTMPNIVAAEGSSGREYDLKDDKHHEAGYDAFLTAACFGAMVSYLGLLLKPPQPMLEPSAEIVRPFANKVFAQGMADMPYLNITGEELTPSRDHVFYLTFPSHWKTNDIMHIFSPFSRVHVAWVDDTSAFVSLARKDQTTQVLQNVKASGLFTLCTYKEWQTRQRTTSTKPKPSVESSSILESPASRLSAFTSPAPSPALRTPPSGGAPRQCTAPDTGPETGASPANGEKQGTAAAKAARSTASDTPTGHSRSAAKKRKRESSGSSEGSVEHKKDSTSKANAELFAVPDW